MLTNARLGVDAKAMCGCVEVAESGSGVSFMFLYGKRLLEIKGNFGGASIVSPAIKIMEIDVSPMVRLRKLK